MQEQKIMGYARVSTAQQNEDRQIIALREMGVPVKNIYIDKMTGKNFERPQYQKMLKQGNAAGAQKAAYQDAMMEEEPVLAEKQGEKVRSQLLEAYHRYDSRAVQLSELYRGSIYWRSILPMAATILLSVGFYAKALFEAVSDLLHQGGTAPAVVYLITGVAFLLHGLMILFAMMQNHS